MQPTVAVISFLIANVILTVAIDTWLRRRRRLCERQLSLTEQICKIRNGIAAETRLIEESLKDKVEFAEWVPIVLDFSRRLRTLSESPTSSAAEIRSLAGEAADCFRKRRIKGFYFADQACELAELLDRQTEVESTAAE